MNQAEENLPLVEEESLEVGGELDVHDLEEDIVVEADVDGVVQLPGGEVLGLGNPGAITIVPNTMGSNTMGSNTMKTLKVAILSGF